MSEWIELGRDLETRGFPLLWIGTTDELSALRAADAAPTGYFIDQIGDGSLTTTAAALSLATMFIGHDSGPLHLANAFGTPVVGVFAPGQPERTFPQGVGESRMLYSPTPEGITAERMLHEVNTLLVSSAP
jgi:ADP-heptose:LPS heptosyltransferase